MTTTMTTERSVIHSTFTIQRNYPVKPERVFAAFADPAKKRRWFGEGEGRDLEAHEMDFRVGGSERICYRMKEGTPFPGTALINHTNYQDIVPNRRIVMAYTMTLGDRRFSASLATVELVPAGDGTDLIFTEQGAYFEGADGPRGREHGWTKLLETLAGELAR
jgi:uncharacterized protein YndB with AHSA1/START domain